MLIGGVLLSRVLGFLRDVVFASDRRAARVGDILRIEGDTVTFTDFDRYASAGAIAHSAHGGAIPAPADGLSFKLAPDADVYTWDWTTSLAPFSRCSREEAKAKRFTTRAWPGSREDIKKNCYWVGIYSTRTWEVLRAFQGIDRFSLNSNFFGDQLGIAIASTLTTFWVLAAVLVTFFLPDIGTRHQVVVLGGGLLIYAAVGALGGLEHGLLAWPQTPIEIIVLLVTQFLASTTSLVVAKLEQILESVVIDSNSTRTHANTVAQRIADSSLT